VLGYYRDHWIAIVGLPIDGIVDSFSFGHNSRFPHNVFPTNTNIFWLSLSLPLSPFLRILSSSMQVFCSQRKCRCNPIQTDDQNPRSEHLRERNSLSSSLSVLVSCLYRFCIGPMLIVCEQTLTPTSKKTEPPTTPNTLKFQHLFEHATPLNA
jgi:hypothetical protein